MRARRIVGGTLAAIAVLLLVGLGVWQIERRAWKLALIEQVERRLAAAPVAAPGPSAWPAIGSDAAYTRVQIRGRFLPNRDSYVQAVTSLGGGFWLLTPLRSDAGWSVLVNRGFVPADQRGRIAPPDAAPVTVSGLLRTTEPKGGFLRRNDPAQDRWYSRDVQAIAARHRLGRVAPYFIDADRTGAGWPRGGMTVVRFPNSHLVYALTWFGLAGMVVALTIIARRRGR
ncbi:SURF1 family protein [Sphingomonas xinjiangensis]|uniref:SURF1-like protein n=1 Tax=Sphingomonas xinjiangensis TaxID=643568 RepID=A0A840YC73_9SPHN|nr:SURF1 family protein [Sphingomonas xinjiangensis]MBB5710967.1 surfeit locus 1 family protein [Sphingomonas xinjiangensis]